MHVHKVSENIGVIALCTCSTSLGKTLHPTDHSVAGLPMLLADGTSPRQAHEVQTASYPSPTTQGSQSQSQTPTSFLGSDSICVLLCIFGAGASCCAYFSFLFNLVTYFVLLMCLKN